MAHEAQQVTPAVRVADPRWVRPTLLAVAAFAGFEYLWGIWRNQMRSDFYGAAVYSMSRSWHAFLYGGFDPAASISIDKIPLAFQVQALFVRVFGFHNWVLVLPQALAGILAVLVMYRVVRRWAGPHAGLLAALILALAPINTALNRATQADALLVLLLLLAADAWQRSLANGRLRTLLLSGVWVGLAFHVKMAQAWAVLPAFAVGYGIAAAGTLRRRLGYLAAAGGVTVGVSSLWMLLVTLTPVADRPYIDGSTNNSVFGMVFGYNLLDRFDATSADAAGVGSVGGGGLVGRLSGHSLWIMFEPNMASQYAWLLPLCLVSLVVAVAWRWRRPRTDLTRACFVMWGLWLLTHLVAFSVGNVAHTFYSAVLAPAIAALAGAGLMMFARAVPGRRMRAWGLPFAVAGTAAWTVYLAAAYPSFLNWLIPITVVLTVVAALVLIVTLGSAERPGRFAAVGVATAVAAMLAVPAGWSVMTLVPPYGGDRIGPVAGPTNTFAATGQSTAGRTGFTGGGGTGGGLAGGGRPGGFAGGGRAGGARPGGVASGNAQSAGGTGGPDQALVSFLRARQGTARYAVAVPGSNSAGPYVMAGLSVLPIGGFTGQVPYPTAGQLARMVSSGALRYVLGGGYRDASGGAMGWVVAHCTTVDASAYTGSSDGGDASGSSAFGGQAALYDCASAGGR